MGLPVVPCVQRDGTDSNRKAESALGTAKVEFFARHCLLALSNEGRRCLFVGVIATLSQGH